MIYYSKPIYQNSALGCLDSNQRTGGPARKGRASLIKRGNMDLTFQSNDLDIDSPSALPDLTSLIFQNDVKNEEVLDQVARGFISPKEAGFRLAGLLMIASDMASAWLRNAKVERDALIRAEAQDQHEEGFI